MIRKIFITFLLFFYFDSNKTGTDLLQSIGESNVRTLWFWISVLAFWCCYYCFLYLTTPTIVFCWSNNLAAFHSISFIFYQVACEICKLAFSIDQVRLHILKNQICFDLILICRFFHLHRSFPNCWNWLVGAKEYKSSLTIGRLNLWFWLKPFVFPFLVLNSP